MPRPAALPKGAARRRGTDMLKIMQGQGFTATQGLGGYIFFANGSEEVLHRTFVYAPAVKREPGSKVTDKYDLAMRMLDFPNNDNLKVAGLGPARRGQLPHLQHEDAGRLRFLGNPGRCGRRR